MSDRIRRFLIGDAARFLFVVWFGLTLLGAAWLASQFASDSRCRLNETTSACHGRRVAEANPLILIGIVVLWVVVAIVIPRRILRRP